MGQAQGRHKEGNRKTKGRQRKHKGTTNGRTQEQQPQPQPQAPQPQQPPPQQQQPQPPQPPQAQTPFGIATCDAGGAGGNAKDARGTFFQNFKIYTRFVVPKSHSHEKSRSHRRCPLRKAHPSAPSTDCTASATTTVATTSTTTTTTPATTHEDEVFCWHSRCPKRKAGASDRIKFQPWPLSQGRKIKNFAFQDGLAQAALAPTNGRTKSITRQ